VPADAKSIATSPAWRNPPVSPRPAAIPREHSSAKFVPSPYFSGMGSSGIPPSPFYNPSGELASLVDDYQRSGDVGVLLDRLKALAKRTAPDLLKTASQPYRDLPEVVIPLYERIVADAPNDAQAIVVLANAYWLTGRGPDYVDQLASRAKQIDPMNRGAWHLWALAESSVRKRVERWQAVTKQFPGDQLARAALADNATSLANDEEDPVALKLAISTYEGLLAESTHTAQRMALEQSLSALRKWKH